MIGIWDLIIESYNDTIINCFRAIRNM